MIASLQESFARTCCTLLVLLLPLAVHAQAPPANDDPAGAIALPLTATCSPTSATNLGATTTAVSGLGYTNPGCGVASSPKDVWFTFTTGTASQSAATITVIGTPAGQVRVFSRPGGPTSPFSLAGCSAGTDINTQAAPLYLQGLSPNTIYYVFVSGYGSNDTPGPFTICATIPAANDIAVEAVHALTKLPTPQGATQVVRAVVTNRGLSPQSNVLATLNVTGANRFNDTQTIPSLAVGTSATVSFAGFPSTITGTNTVTVSTPTDGNDLNNSLSVAQAVNPTTYSYATAPGSVTGRGYGPPSVTLYNVYACRFLTSASLNVTEVRAYLVNGSTGASATEGKTVFGVLLDGNGNVLVQSSPHVVTAAEINTYVSFPLPLVSLPAGTDMYVGLAQTYQTGQNNQYYALGSQPDGVGRTGAFYATSTLTRIPPYDLAAQGFGRRLLLEAVTTPAPLCSSVTNLAVSNVTQTGATLNFTPPAGASSFSITYAANGGPSTTVTSTASSVVLTGLSPASAYVVSVATSCGGGQTSIPATFSFLTTQVSAPYATLPVAESFEGTWLSVGAVRDAPATNWRNSPPTGTQSWRRDDDGTSADWLNVLGAYTPASSAGSHSARFHSYDAPFGTLGALDLYVDLSAPGLKTLNFDCINADGTDLLRVYVSADGGASFGALPITAVAVSPTFTTHTVTLNSNSATTVLRFRATSDYGETDIGLDNVRLAVATATRSEALAATVGLYPNPAHRAFALAVPAGPLTAAAATLRNALGQVVLTRPLNLPAAGGTAAFDVRRLAPGVYTLQLQTGETLVVKRVVVE